METAPDLDGRTALVTGSAKRVGRELLLTIAAYGADVVVHYRNSADAAEETAAAAREYGVDATAVQGEITDPESVDAMFSAAESALGTVDILVKNVGNFDARHGRTSSGRRSVTLSKARSTGRSCAFGGHSTGCVKPAGAES